MNEERNFKVIYNPNARIDAEVKGLNVKDTEQVRAFHKSVPSYEETPLVPLNDLAKRLGVKGIYAKDESKRFGLNAFKGLGGIYALSRIACETLGLSIENTRFTDLKASKDKGRLQNMVFVTATDGNHGKGVAWAASQLGCQSHVYMPKGSSEIRAQAIRDAGATEVKITDMGYDDAVRYAWNMSKELGWVLVQDTSLPGYEKVPFWIIQGYTTMVYEALEHLSEQNVKPTHVFLQAGVGAMAGAVTGFLAGYYGKERPKIAIVEPEGAACIYESARIGDGKPHAATGNGRTIMAGLNCGEPCPITWPILRDCADAYMCFPDYVAARGMRIYASPLGTDAKVISGESGASTMGAFSLVMESPKLSDVKERLGLDGESVVLLFNTEGDTDPISYRRIVYDGAYPTPNSLFE